MDVETDLPTTTSSGNPPAPIRLILPNSYQFTLSNDDLQRLMEMRRMFYQKENERKLSKLGLPILVENSGCISQMTTNLDETVSSSTGRTIRRRDMEWLEIVLPFVKNYNPHCGVCASSKNYGRRLDMVKSYLLRSYFYCQGRDCPFNCILTIKENGKGLICSRSPDGHLVDHRNAKRVARPNRSMKKLRSFKSKTKRGEITVNPVLKQWNQTVTVDDEIPLRKRWTNLHQLVETFREEIEPNGLVNGAIQHISLSPLSVVVHTEKSIRFYENILTKKSPPLIQVQTTNQSQIIIVNNDSNHIVYLLSQKSDDNQLVYNEFLLNQFDDSTFIPISFALHQSTDNRHDESFALKIWLDRIRFDHERLYKSTFPTLSNNYRFPNPYLILIDDHRETSLNNVVLQFYNNESFRDYLMRTYLLLSSKIEYPSQQECQTRVLLHRPSTSIFIELRQLVLQHVPSELRQLGLWSTLLLLHTSSWKEIRQIWTLVCEIFLNWGTNFVSLKSYEELCGKVSKIENDAEISHLIDLISNSNVTNVEENSTDFDDDDDEAMNDEVIDLTDFQNDHLYTKNMFINDHQPYVSPYESDLRRIFNDKNQSKSALISSWETLSTTDRTTLKKIRGNFKWLNLLLKDFIPTMVIWSNLIVSISPNNRFKQLHLNKRLSKILVNRDKRSNQIQRIQLAERVHGKTDVLVTNLTKDFHQQISNIEMILV